MQAYRAQAPVTIAPGSLLHLSDAQADARAYGLTREGTGWRVRLPVQFKAGEEFGYQGELPKALAARVSSTATQPAKPRPEKHDTDPDES